MDKPWTETQYNNLYRANDFLSDENKKTLGLLIPVDVYVQDPLLAKQKKEQALDTIYVSNEPELMDGPTSARIAVVDYDADANKLTKPARWDAKNRRFVFTYKGKTAPVTAERCDEFQFHQVNAWAIVASVLGIYEQTWVLGRPAPWACSRCGPRCKTTSSGLSLEKK